jgi:hypothetical protein
MIRRIRIPSPRKVTESPPALLESPFVVERDDGLFEIAPCGSGPFPTRGFALAVWLKQTRHDDRWVRQ